MTVDIHAHFFPPAVLDYYRRYGGDRAGVVDIPDGALQVLFQGRVFHARLPQAIHDEAAHIKLMDDIDVELHAISLPPPMVYWADPSEGRDLCQIANDEMLAMSQRNPGRFIPAASLPLQAPQMAIDELHRAVGLGYRLVGIGTNVDDVQLDHPSLESFWAEAEKLDVAVFIHPIICRWTEHAQSYRLDLAVGMTTETTMAAARVVNAGLPDRYPNLRLCWSHLGGYLPFIADRIDYFQKTTPGGSNGGRAQEPFLGYFDRFWYDSCVYSPRTLAAGLQFVDSSRIMFGTDTPFLGDSTDDIRQLIESSPDLTPEQRDGVMGGNARAFLKLDQ
jgi:aminocarboxymuconate-semialdehyde decarboxylase